MRSSRLIAALLLVAGLGMSCDNRDDRVGDICQTLAECSNYLVDEACTQSLVDELVDRRLTDSDMARCAKCLGDHDRKSFDEADELGETKGKLLEDCYDLLVERDCDMSCSAVSLALRVKTNKQIRSETCERFGEVCGTASAPCAAELEATFDGLELEAQLQLDERMQGCHDCIVAPAEQSDDVSELAACNSRVIACGESCRQVGPVNALVELASQIVTVCKNDATCFAAPDAEGRLVEPERRETALQCLARLLQDVGAAPSNTGFAADGAAGAPTEASGEPSRERRPIHTVKRLPAALAAPREAPSKDLRAALADCALCIDTLPCDAIAKNCAERCADVGRR